MQCYVRTWGESASWFLGLIVGLITFMIPGIKLAGFVSKNVYSWASTRILNQLSEEGQRIAKGVVKNLLWAKIFLVVCFVLFTGGFVVCYINAI